MPYLAAANDTQRDISYWSFVDDSNNQSRSLIDLSWLNENTAGETGWIRTSSDGNSFVKGNGEPIRFWSVGTTVAKKAPQKLASHAKFLAQRGVNMVRWHENIISSSEDLYAIDQKALDELFLLVAAMKKEGIYTTISPYYAHAIRKSGYGKNINKSWPVPRNPDAKNMGSLLFFDPILQNAYKAWIRKLFTTVNPYTGLSLKNDPSVALFQIQNEDSLLFWTFNHLKGGDRRVLEQQYTQWLLEKYKSLEAIKKHWNNAKPKGKPNRDNWKTGPLTLSPIWSLTQPNPLPKQRQRLRDQTEFLSHTMRNWNLEVTNFLRNEIGTKLLINAGNWKTASPKLLNDLERYTYTTSDVIAVNRYVHGVHTGKNSGWAITNGHKFNDFSVLKNPDKLPVALKQIEGFPTIVTESAWVSPLSYQAEGPFVTSVMQSLNGIDSVYWFNADTPRWKQPGSANGFLPSLSKWSIQTPMIVGQFPAAALNFRLGFITEEKAIIHENRSVNRLYDRLPSAITEQYSYDPNRDRNDTPSEANYASDLFSKGPVKISYQIDDSTKLDSKKRYHHRGENVIQNNQVEWIPQKGTITVNSPSSQGICGFTKKSITETADIIFELNNSYACVWAVSMTPEPINTSPKVLIQIGTRQFPENWSTHKSTFKYNNRSIKGYQVVSYGKAPWKIENLRAQIKLLTAPFTKAQALTSNGMHKEHLEIETTTEGQTLKLPNDSLYVLLTR